VRVGDARAEIDPVTGRPAAHNPGRVLDRDLQEIANELWRSGAEAIAINGQRLISTSTIRVAGGAILVDFRPVTSPYEVSAVGSGGLDRRFTESGTGRRFRRIAEVYRMEYTVRAQRGLTLPAAAEPQLRHARPIEEPPPGSAAPGSGAPGSEAPGSASPSRGPSGGGR
jgi:uncharacterized protein YlxW (UPF0749 family)